MNVYTVTNKLIPVNPLVPLSLDEIIFMVIHHTESLGNYTWEQCNRDHKARKWSCCGYNEMIYPNGDVYIIRGDNVGAHCMNYNSCSYGISLVGSFDKEHISKEQLNSLIERLNYHKRRFKNLKSILGHRDLNNTECPGRNINMADIINKLNNKPGEHWAEKFWKNLNEKGIKINEKRYENPITRGEIFSLLSQIIDKG